MLPGFKKLSSHSPNEETKAAIYLSSLIAPWLGAAAIVHIAHRVTRSNHCKLHIPGALGIGAVISWFSDSNRELRE